MTMPAANEANEESNVSNAPREPALSPCPFCNALPDPERDNAVTHDEKCFFTLIERRAKWWSPNPGVMEAAWNRRDGESRVRGALVARIKECEDALQAVDDWLMAGYEDSDADNSGYNMPFRKALKKVRAVLNNKLPTGASAAEGDGDG